MEQIDLMQGIKALEKRANEAKYWKDKYDVLHNSMEPVANQLTNVQKQLAALMGTKVVMGEKKKASASSVGWGEMSIKINSLVDEAYKMLVVEDGLEITVKNVERILADNSLNVNNGSVSKFTNGLKARNGVQIRKEGIRKFYYYNGTSKVNLAHMQEKDKVVLHDKIMANIKKGGEFDAVLEEHSNMNRVSTDKW